MIARRRVRADNEQTNERLRLVETLLGNHELIGCVASAMDWLESTWHVRRALCLGRSEDGSVLRPIAWRGFPVEAVSRFLLPTTERFHPLVKVLRKRKITSFPASMASNGRRPLTPFGDDGFQAVGMRSSRFAGEPIGLLLTDAPALLASELDWFASVLAQKIENLVQMPVADALDREHENERSLLLRIINAISDPILLSDVEGRMVLANGPALRLFVASEEES